MSAHTPTPWRISESDPNDSGEYYFGEGAYGIEAEAADDLYLPYASIAILGVCESNKANAAFIVLACNSHDSLVAALRQYLDADTFNRGESALHDARAAAQAALRAIGDA